MRKKLLESLIFLVLFLLSSVLTRSKEAISLEIRAEPGSLIALDKGEEIWRITHLSLGKRSPVSSILHYGQVYYGVGNQLISIDSQSGTLTRRVYFPGEIQKISPASGEHLELQLRDNNVAWQKIYDPTETPPRLITTNQPAFLHLLYHDAREISPELFNRETSSLSPEALKSIVKEALKASQKDPLNPWFNMLIGKAYQLMNQSDKAHVFYQAALSLPSIPFYDLWHLSSFFEEVGEAGLAQEAFEGGYAQFLARGYQPLQVLSLVFMANYAIVPLGSRFIQQGEEEKALRLAERLYRVAPQGEATDHIYRSVAQWLERQGRAEEARVWNHRAKEAEPLASFGLYAAEQADITLNLFIGLTLGVILYLGYLTFRPWRQMFDALKSIRERDTLRLKLRQIWRSHVSKREWLGLWVAVVGSWASIIWIGFHLQVITRLSVMPYALGSGTWANQSTTEALEKLYPSLGRDLLVAIAYQQAERREEATMLYRKLGEHPVAQQNLKTVSSHQSSSLALPSATDYQRAFLGSLLSFEWLLSPFRLFDSLSGRSTSSPTTPRGHPFEIIGALLVYFLPLLPFLLYRKRFSTQSVPEISWLLLLPGLARIWQPFGVLLFSLWISCLWVVFVIEPPFIGIISSLIQPNLTSYLFPGYQYPLSPLYHFFTKGAWMIPLVNLFYLLAGRMILRFKRT